MPPGVKDCPQVYRSSKIPIGTLSNLLGTLDKRYFCKTFTKELLDRVTGIICNKLINLAEFYNLTLEYLSRYSTFIFNNKTYNNLPHKESLHLSRCPVYIYSSKMKHN